MLRDVLGVFTAQPGSVIGQQALQTLLGAICDNLEPPTQPSDPNTVDPLIKQSDAAPANPAAPAT